MSDCEGIPLFWLLFLLFGRKIWMMSIQLFRCMLIMSGDLGEMLSHSPFCLFIYLSYWVMDFFANLSLQSTIWNESKGRLMQALSPPASPKRAGSPDGSCGSNDDDHTSPPPKKAGRYEFSQPSHYLSDDYSDDEESNLHSK
uniref:Dph1 protein n=1 Tax=Fopius arisanus TaxID=64838 RepID=A0A0C9QBM6_9HYME